MTFKVPDPELQVDFAATLAQLRSRCLQDALSETVRSLHVPDIDRELAECVPGHSLSVLAAHGLRGEMMFPVSCVLQKTPRLLGYYRLLYGYSQKEFYTTATGLGKFKAMEERGKVPGTLVPQLPNLCRALCQAGVLLLAGIGTTRVSAALLHDLTLLTLGPQLRGGANVKRGTAGIRAVFNAVSEIVDHAVLNLEETRIEIRNAAGRTVLIEFAADPDIIILETMQSGAFRKVIAIEVKAGSDFSNIHNRIGEAEKSHQKAKADGYAECWTVVNVDRTNMAMARQESPSTNRFYLLSDLTNKAGDYEDFKDRVVSLTGI